MAEAARCDLSARDGRQARYSDRIAGSGKTTVLTPLVDALRAEGRQVYGAALSWKQTSALGGAGIDRDHRAAIDAFLKRVDRGKYKLDRNTTLIIDEIGQVGRRQMLDILGCNSSTASRCSPSAIRSKTRRSRLRPSNCSGRLWVRTRFQRSLPL